MIESDFTHLLRRSLAFPANLLLLAVIVQQNFTSIEQVTVAAKIYGLPEIPEYGLFNWLENGVLEGTIWQFKPNEVIATKLAFWVQRNWEALSELSALYPQQLTREQEIVVEKKIVDKIRFELLTDG